MPGPVLRVIGKSAVIALVLVCVSTTGAFVFGFEGGGCGCVFVDSVCGVDGYMCFCCGEFDPATDHPVISKCRMGASFFSLPAAPAIQGAAVPSVALDGPSHTIRPVFGHQPVSGFSGLPERPPSA